MEMRLIDADKATKLIDDVFSVDDGRGLIPTNITKALVRSILTLESITPTIGRWISIKERLPDTYTRILIFGFIRRQKEHMAVEDMIVEIGFREDLNWWLIGIGSDIENDIRVTHWMPLPEPPEEVSGDV